MFFNGMTTYIVIACGITALPDFLAKYFFSECSVADMGR
jgi:hypothetical protein